METDVLKETVYINIIAINAATPADVIIVNLIIDLRKSYILYTGKRTTSLYY